MNDRPLRIAHIDTERTWRGGENQVFSLVKGLSSRNHFNLLVVRPKSALSQKFKSTNQAVYFVCPWGEWDFFAAHFLNRKLKKEKIDVVHAHTAHGTALAVLATFGTKIPVVVTRRVDFHLSMNPFSHWKYKRAKKIITISKGVEQILLEDGIPEEKMEVIPSGIDFSRFQGITPATKEEMNVPPNSILIGQVAALAPHKDQFTFLKAIALLKQKYPLVHAVLVGEGELRSELEKCARQLGIEAYAHFLGFRDDALRFLAGFDIFCLSSKEEGLGTSILDAMALRIPVVATRVGGIPELIEPGVTGYLSPPRDPENLAKTLSVAIDAGDKNKIICDLAYAKSRFFDIQHTVSQTEGVYRSVLK